jgi:hypothetical protein
MVKSNRPFAPPMSRQAGKRGEENCRFSGAFSGGGPYMRATSRPEVTALVALRPMCGYIVLCRGPLATDEGKHLGTGGSAMNTTLSLHSPP